MSRERLIQNNSDDYRTFIAFLAYIFFLIPIFTRVRDDEFVVFHAKQGFALFCMFLIIGVVQGAVGSVFLTLLLTVIVFLFWCIGVTNVVLNHRSALPLIGQLFVHLKL